MITAETLIVTLDRELRSLHHLQASASKQNYGNTSIDPLLQEYLQLIRTEAIIRPIEYMVLDALVQHFNLYTDERDRQQILSAMGEEFSQANDKDILVSLQIVQSTYPSLYRIGQAQIDLTRTRAIEHITKLPVVELPVRIAPKIEPKPLNLATYIEPKPVLPSPNTNIVAVIRESILEIISRKRYTKVKKSAKSIAFWIGYICRIATIGTVMILGALIGILGFILGVLIGILGFGLESK